MLKEAGIIQIGESKIPYVWASTGQKPTLPEKPNYIVGANREKVGLILPDQAQVFLWESAPGWGGDPGITYFLKQLPWAITVRKLVWDKKLQVKQFTTDTFLEGIHNPHLNPQKPFIYPDNLADLVKIAEEQWGWNIEPRIFKLLAQASLGLSK